MKSLFFILLFFLTTCFHFGFCQDVKYITHWKNKTDCCLHYFNNAQFVGLLLDGSKLQFVDPFLCKKIKGLTQFVLDSVAFKVQIDTLLIHEFENNLKDSLSNNKLLLNKPPFLDISFYYRQYIGFVFDGKSYLFVGLNLDLDRLQWIDGRYYYPNFENSSHVELSEERILVDSRHFIFPAMDYSKNFNNPIYILYEIVNARLKFIFVESISE